MVEISVIVVSRGRPRHLKRCLFSLFQMSAPNFELVVVADPEGLSAIDDLPFSVTLKKVAFDTPNISRARNAGIAAAAGSVLAFIDDDAVAEPGWLAALVAPFQDGAMAATGAVKGRNGFSYQTAGEVVDACGVVRPSPVPEAGEALKLIGTNMAIARAALEAQGGFDENLAFYMDDTEISWRLRHEPVVYVPDAIVHHSAAASERRTPARRPLRLLDVGRSITVFLRRHAPRDAMAQALAAHRADQRRRLVAHMVRGSAEPATIRALMSDFEDGILLGQSQALSDLTCPPPSGVFKAWDRPVVDPAPLILTHRLRQKRALKRAARIATTGAPVTVLSMSRTGRRHVLTFDETGVWVQRGGTFGRSVRNQKPGIVLRLKMRAKVETVRLFQAGLCLN